MSELLAVAGLAAVCALWVVVQRSARRLDPDEPGVVRGCGGCTAAEGGGEADGLCRRDGGCPAAPPVVPGERAR